MQRLILPLLLASSTLAACSSLPTGPAPTAEQTAQLPVVTLGQPLPPGDAYVLYFPAGTPLPIRTEVGGSAFAKGGESTLHVTLKRGIYGYRQYASFDQKTWVPWNQMLDTQLHLHIPSKNGKDAAVLDLQMNLR
ncbi:hypothetical protein [Thiomonas bhubaneswarensis]|uniref:Lipoprotein n=1 Tax=Thiomonas bhubaneswarensis TaxID=339866 RepID=A0A0K6HSC3_9BURK|nr:hypothetical protein [Thiomonas bhubaneswarensis]CUA93820.1 hypothetical protein Ga0061069_101371 [Thiomonas bhubaneswarensis]